MLPRTHYPELVTVLIRRPWKLGWGAWAAVGCLIVSSTRSVLYSTALPCLRWIALPNHAAFET